MLRWVIHKLTSMVFHQSPEAAKSSEDNPAHSVNTNSHTESSKDDPAHPANTIMSPDPLNPDPLPAVNEELKVKAITEMSETKAMLEEKCRHIKSLENQEPELGRSKKRIICKICPTDIHMTGTMTNPMKTQQD